MTEVDRERRILAEDRVERALRDSGNEQLVNIAEELAAFEPIAGEYFAEGTTLQSSTIEPTADQLRRIRKVADVLEDELNVDVGHGKFTRLATTAATLNSLASIIIAANNLIQASEVLWEEHNRKDDLEEIEDETYELFLQSSCILLLECILFTTPFNYKIAWKGTRKINNRYLYRLNGDSSTPLYRLLLSEIHYFIRDIVPAKIRESAEYFAKYLVSMVRKTLELRDEYENIQLRDIDDEVRDTVDEFVEFAKSKYDVGKKIIDQISIAKIYPIIKHEVFDLVDVPDIDTGEIVDFDSPI